MKRILFSPFDIGKWFILGFSAWLATLLEGCGSNGGTGNFFDLGSDDTDGSGTGGGLDDVDWNEVKDSLVEFYSSALVWIQENPVMPMIVAGLVCFVIVLVVVLQWVGSRGKFMFLDNVVWDRALVAQPWKEFKRQGNSLFWWKLGFGIFKLLATLAFLGGGAWYVMGGLETGGWDSTRILIVGGIGVGFFCYVILMGYIGMLLENFVIPVMYEYNLSTSEAWLRFLPLHNPRMFRFILFGIWKLLLGIVVGVALIVFVLGTCCLGLILMAIPYIGAVVLLPATVFFRSLGPEYLAQLGEEWDVLYSEDAV